MIFTKKKNTHVAIEASSHGLVQNRLRNIVASCVGFIFFASDHLDYTYGSVEQYLNAKLISFSPNTADKTTKVLLKSSLLDLFPANIKNTFDTTIIGESNSEVVLKSCMKNVLSQDLYFFLNEEENLRSITSMLGQYQIY